MDDVIRIDDRWYVLATSSRADDRTRVLKHDDTFAVFDRYGDIQHIGIGEQGLYHQGTRFLSHYELKVNERRPILLNSSVKQDNSLLVVDMTTPDLYDGGALILPKGTLHIFRAILLWHGVRYEHIRLANYSDIEVDIDVDLEFRSDYADIFEVRGIQREARGTDLPIQCSQHGVVLGYRGLDDVERRTRIAFDRLPDHLGDDSARLNFGIPSRGSMEFYVSTACEVSKEEDPVVLSYNKALSECTGQTTDRREQVGNVYTSNEQFNDWINRSAADLDMLTTETRFGNYPFAGVPWFSTPFGRDGIITALQYLALAPDLARGVLGYLAATQATSINPDSDAEPGKILHEARKGEMSELGEVPFKLYYGTVDATPLFISLAGAYYQRTGDRDFIASIRPNIEAALDWIDNYGDSDGDGFVDYARHSDDGLVQQGWKDSNDSVFHADGRPAKAPIALCEVQGYVYDARRSAARLMTLFGENECAAGLRRQAADLKERFNRAFWCDDIDTYAIAIDGNGKPCKIRSSNAGHVLLSGIADTAHARRVARTLLSSTSFSGWGVRTVAMGECRYNPMSYHNGSIWPHDNAMIGMGLARYGYKQEAIRILTGMFDISIALDLHRLPELFCGFDRLPGQGPTLYPVACSPQAWASGTVFYLLQACLGMAFSAERPQLRFYHPQLPDYLQSVQITNLRIGDATADLAFTRHPRDVSVNVLRKTGKIDVNVVV